MKLEIFGFRQMKMKKLGLKVEEALVLRWFIDFQGSGKMKEVISRENGKTYFWVSLQKLVEDLPVLLGNTKAASRRLQNLVELGILENHLAVAGPEGGRKTAYRITDEAFSALLEEEEPNTQNCPFGSEPKETFLTPNTQNCPFGSNNNNINKIYNTGDKLLDNYSSEPLKKAPSSSPVFIDLPLNNGSLYSVTEDQVSKWSELYPAVDVRQQLRAMWGWCDSNPSKRKTSTGITRFINSWLAREQDRGGPRGSYSGTNAQVTNPISNEAFAGAKGGEEAW